MTKRAVHKYEISPNRYPFSVLMPVGAVAIHVALQHGTGKLWCLVDPEATEVSRRVIVIGTGWMAVPDGYKHVGTYHQDELVWHVFID